MALISRPPKLRWNDARCRFPAPAENRRLPRPYHLAHEIEVVFNDQNAQPVDACEGGQELRKTTTLGAREPRRRLVEQHDLRLERQHHRELQRLLQSVA
jgi:hypothetical protein